MLSTYGEHGPEDIECYSNGIRGSQPMSFTGLCIGGPDDGLIATELLQVRFALRYEPQPAVFDSPLANNRIAVERRRRNSPIRMTMSGSASGS